jgi:hypothetical protein
MEQFVADSQRVVAGIIAPPESANLAVAPAARARSIISI